MVSHLGPVPFSIQAVQTNQTNNSQYINTESTHFSLLKLVAVKLTNKKRFQTRDTKSTVMRVIHGSYDIDDSVPRQRDEMDGDLMNGMKVIVT